MGFLSKQITILHGRHTVRVSLAEVDDACNVYYCVLTLHELNFIYCWHSCKAP